jgi:TP901 family phage tail tape measure protein
MAEQLSLGDLTWKLGFDSEDQFLSALNELFAKAEAKAKSGGAVGGEEFGKAFTAKAKQSASGFGDDFIRSLGIQTLGTFLGQALQTAFQSAISATQQFVSDSNREFRSYQINLNTIATNTNESLDKIKAGIKSISDESRVFSEVEVSRGVAELIKAGYDASTALNIVSKSANLAKSEINDLTGQYADLGGVSKQVSDVMAGFGIQTGDVARVVDVLAKGAAQSKLGITDLVEAIAPIGSFAKNAGLSLEETVSAIAQLKNTGLPAAEAATALRTVLQQLITPPQNVKKAFDELGLTLIKADGTLRPFPEILANIQRVAESGGRGVQLLSYGLGTYGNNAAQALGKAQQATKDFSIELQNSAGYAQQYADSLNKGIISGADFDRQIANAKRALGEQLKPVLLDLYTNILPPFIRLIQDAAPLLERLASAIDNIGKPTFKPGAKDALEALYTDADKADVALTRIADNQKKLDLAREKLSTATAVPAVTLAANLQIDATKKEIANLEQAIAADQKILDGLKRQAAESSQAVATTPNKPTSTADPSAFTVGRGNPSGRSRTPKDPILEQAQELDKNLRLLETRFTLGQVPLEKYQAELSTLEGRFQTLGKSARSTDQQLAVAEGLKAVQAAREKQDKLDQEARAKAAQSEVDQARWVAEQKTESYKLAYEAEKQYQDELDRQKAQAVQTDFERARDVASAQAASFQKALDDKAKLVDTTNDVEGLEALKAFYENLGLTGEAAYQRILTKLDELYTFQKQFGAESAKNREANILASDKTLQQQLFDARQVAASFAENPKLFTQADLDKTSQAIDLLELYGQDVGHLRELLGQATTEFVQMSNAASGVFSDQAPVQDYINNFDKLVLQLKTGETTSAEFRAQAEAIIAQLDKYAAIAASNGDFTLFDAANKAADALFTRLNDIIGLGKTAVKGPDNTVLGKLPEDLKAAGDDVGELEGKVNSLIVALNNAPTDPLELEAFANEVNTQMFALFDELEAKLAALPPDDPAVARLQQTLDLLRQIAIVGTSMPNALPAYNAPSQAQQQYRAGERDPGNPVISAPPSVDFSNVEKQLGNRMTSIAGTFIKDLIGGATDVGGALKKALGDASSFFLDQMIQGIIGPIAQELGKAVAGSLFEKGATGALSLGPLGLIVGGGLLLGSLLLGSGGKSASQQAAESSRPSTGGASSITYESNLTLNVPYVGSLADPNFRAQLRDYVFSILEEFERRLRPAGAGATA